MDILGERHDILRLLIILASSIRKLTLITVNKHIQLAAQLYAYDKCVRNQPTAQGDTYIFRILSGY